MPKRAIVAATILAITTTDASAQREQGYLAGLGTTSCADFGDSYRRDPKATDLYYFVWAQGYMSALNTSREVFKRGKIKDLNAWTRSDQQVHLRSFCERRPLLLFAFAVLDLYGELPDFPDQH